jgi:hypothetical protein
VPSSHSFKIKCLLRRCAADGSRSLSDYFSRIKFDEHRGVSFEVFDGHRETEIVEKEELELEMVELSQGKPADLQTPASVKPSNLSRRAHFQTYLRVSRVGVENVREKLARAGHARNDQPMDVEAVHHEIRRC